jgi:hypothetical protein
MARKTSCKSDTVIAFPGASRCTEDGGAAEIVALLESYLIRARRGELDGIAIVTSSADYPNELAMKIGNADPLALLATVTVAQKRLARVADPVTN